MSSQAEMPTSRMAMSSGELFAVATDAWKQALRTKHTKQRNPRTAVLAVVFCGVALECYVNEVIELARGLTKLEKEQPKDLQLAACIRSIGQQSGKLMGVAVSLQQKYKTVLQMLSGQQVDPHRREIAECKFLIDLRHALVHMKARCLMRTSGLCLQEEHPKEIKNGLEHRKLWNPAPVVRPPLPDLPTAWMAHLESPKTESWGCHTALALLELTGEALVATRDRYVSLFATRYLDAFRKSWPGGQSIGGCASHD